MHLSPRSGSLAPLILLALALGDPGARGQDSRQPEALEFSDPLSWEPEFAGIDLAEMTIHGPVRMRGFAARVDLGHDGIEIVVTPDNGARPGETDALHTSTFLKMTECNLAINANPFSPVHLAEGKPQDVIGLLVDAGAVVSPAQAGLPALLIDAGNRATIAEPPADLSRVRYAVGGFGIVLTRGAVTARGTVRHPRTAAGISPDGRYLYLLVIDGRQPGYSDGASTSEVGVWLRMLGASEGINLDGGGTSTFVKRDTDGKAVVINRPIHLGIPGSERPSASHLGVRAKALAARKPTNGTP